MFSENKNIENKIAIIIMLEKILAEQPDNENLKRYLDIVHEQDKVDDEEFVVFKDYADTQKVCAT